MESYVEKNRWQAEHITSQYFFASSVCKQNHSSFEEITVLSVERKGYSYKQLQEVSKFILEHQKEASEFAEPVFYNYQENQNKEFDFWVVPAS